MKISTGRDAHMKQMLQNESNVTRIEGLQGRDDDEWCASGKYFGAKGLYKTFRTIVDRACRDTRANHYYLLLEDDVILYANWRASLSECLPYAPVNWDIIRLHTWGNKHRKDIVNTCWRRTAWNKMDYGGTHAVFLETGNRSCRILRFMQQRKPCWHDHAILNKIKESYELLAPAADTMKHFKSVIGTLPLHRD